jgi:hypothetical protein
LFYNNDNESFEDIPMVQEQSSTADLFRRAQEIRSANPQLSYKQIKGQLVNEFKGKPFPALYNLTIPSRTRALRKKIGRQVCRSCVAEFSFRTGAK